MTIPKLKRQEIHTKRYFLTILHSDFGLPFSPALHTLPLQKAKQSNILNTHTETLMSDKILDRVCFIQRKGDVIRQDVLT